MSDGKIFKLCWCYLAFGKQSLRAENGLEIVLVRGLTHKLTDSDEANGDEGFYYMVTMDIFYSFTSHIFKKHLLGKRYFLHLLDEGA